MISEGGSASRTRRPHLLIVGVLFGVVEGASFVSGGALLAAVIGGLCLTALAVLAVPVWIGLALERRQDKTCAQARRTVEQRLFDTADTTVIPAITSQIPGGAGASSPYDSRLTGFHSTTGRHRLQAAS